MRGEGQLKEAREQLERNPDFYPLLEKLDAFVEQSQYVAEEHGLNPDSLRILAGDFAAGMIWVAAQFEHLGGAIRHWVPDFTYDREEQRPYYIGDFDNGNIRIGFPLKGVIEHIEQFPSRLNFVTQGIVFFARPITQTGSAIES